jgi:hypothetical protein
MTSYLIPAPANARERAEWESRVAAREAAGLGTCVGDDYQQTRYLDRAAVGAVFGVTARAVAQWQDRHPDFPAPDVLLGDRELPGWHPDRLDEIKAWHKDRPGQGAPGRPKPGAGRRKAQPE